MKKIFILIPIAVLLSCCGTTQSSNSGKRTASKRFVHSGNNSEADSIIITGTQYIPVLGKSEAGVRPDIMGMWVLQSMPGSVTTINTNKNIVSETAQAMEVAKRNGEKRDSLVTKTKDGLTRTETTIVYMNDNRGNKITPPQSANHHLPEKPSLNFYGSNETFSGFTGCNKISGRYSITGTNAISFKNAAASTKMMCIGDYDENAYLATLQRVDSYKVLNGQLQLMEGDKVLLVFSKK